MMRRFSQARWSHPCRLHLPCILAAAALACARQAPAQQLPDLFAPQVQAKKHDHASQKPPEGPASHPYAEIPLQPLGFAPPSIFHLGDRWVQSSLDFLDEDHLLFTFRVPGLVVRDPLSSETGDQSTATEGRNIHAVVLALPSGRVEAEALWRLHDYATYLWPLSGGRFLLRDRNMLQIGDGSLHLEPFLRFPGAVRYLELDPAQTMLVTQNFEPRPGVEPESSTEPNGAISGNLAANHNPNSSHGSDHGSDQGSSAAPSVLPMPGSNSNNPHSNNSGSNNPDSNNPDKADKQSKPEKQELSTYLRLFRMSDRKILTTTQIPGGLVHVAIDAQGFYDVSRTSLNTWQILYHTFDGPEITIDQIQSNCSPPLDVLTQGVVLASACDDSGGRQITAITRDQRTLWHSQSSPTHIWPLLTASANGLRLARATLDVSHAVTPSSPLDEVSDIRGQTIQVFDVATGKLALVAPAKPVMDGGGNFALSPSGNRFAAINAGAIQIYDLAPAPPLPAILPPPSINRQISPLGP